MRKQMEGDNQRRRTLARQARERGRRPSESDDTLSASKQLTHLDRNKRHGPPPSGSHKPDTTRGGPAPPQAGRPEVSRPMAEQGQGTAVPAGTVGYRDLVAKVSQRTGLDFDEARHAAAATVMALASVLEESDRERLLNAVPATLHDGTPLESVRHRTDLGGFLDEVARLSNDTPEQAAYSAAATLTVLSEQNPDLVDSLEFPDELHGLLPPPEPGGGVVGTAGHTAPLDAEAVREALTGLPYWSGDTRSLSRTVVLPAENLRRVLDRLDLLESQTGRRPHIARKDSSIAVITVATRQVDAVTALDVALAHRVDEAIEEVAAGIAG